jgi:hypothetical protein
LSLCLFFSLLHFGPAFGSFVDDSISFFLFLPDFSVVFSAFYFSSLLRPRAPHQLGLFSPFFAIPFFRLSMFFNFDLAKDVLFPVSETQSLV